MRADQRDARTGVSERLRHLRNRGRSRHRPADHHALSTVDDVGRCINPLIVHGQTHGGIAQGVGQAMWEQCYIDPSSGQPLAGSFMDYGMPHAAHATVVQGRDRRGAFADQSARHQGRRRRRHDTGARGDRQRRRRCAEGLRHSRHPNASDAVRDLAGDPGCEGEAKSTSSPKGR